MANTLTLNARGADVKALHEGLTKLGYTLPANELEGSIYGVGTRNAVRLFQQGVGLKATGEVDEDTAAALAEAVERAGVKTNRIEGRLYYKDGTRAPKTRFAFYNVGLQGTKPVDVVTTDDNGYYALDFAPDNYQRMEARWVESAKKWKAISKPLDPALDHRELDLVLPIGPDAMEPEYKRMLTALGTALKTKNVKATEKRLAELAESETEKDITVLYEETGWDARYIALAAKATKASANTGLDAEVLYALYRTGLPMGTSDLAKVGAANVSAALTRASEAGVASLDEARIKEGTERYSSFAIDAVAGMRLSGGLSSVMEMLTVSGLSKEQWTTMQSALVSSAGDADALWTALDSAGFSEAQISSLQTQGKLAYLTFNNAPLTAALMAKDTVTGPEALVDSGYYASSKWAAKIQELADSTKTNVADLIPSAFKGANDAETLSNYSEELARKVRISYPSETVQRKIATDELTLGEDHATVKAPTLAFMSKANALGFKIGRQSVSCFIRDHEAELFTTDAEKRDQELVVETTKKLTRLYQITPTDDALQVLLSKGITSAKDVVMMSEPVFVQRYRASLGYEIATMVYRKARQVNSVAYGIYRSAKQVDTAVATNATSAPGDEAEAAKEETKETLIKVYPTLETLFGSMDFCECEHCRSVLGPAAYFVDLLQFLEVDPTGWDRFLEDWRDRHPGSSGGAPEEYTDNYVEPFDALMARRPDLQHIPLTCENTNTAMPLIDIALEIMEYFVANGALAADAAKDTGEATSEELIAEPQYIIASAYDELKGSVYPIGLPFDLWTETARAFLDHFDTPLWQLLETFRLNDELFTSANAGIPYYRQAVFAEQLDLSQTELDLFTNPATLGDWFTLYGFATAAEASAVVNKAKDLSDLLGITYQELYDLMDTRFINRRVEIIEMLRRAGASTSDAYAFGAGTLSTEDSAALEAKLNALADEFGSSIDMPAWIKQEYNAGHLDEILLFSDTTAACDLTNTTIQYADGSPAESLVFLKMNLFVRLWRKLGWTMREVDEALHVFLPKATNASGETFADIDTPTKLASGMKTALVYLAHQKELARRFKGGKYARSKWLSLWSNIPGHGAKDQETGEHHLYGYLFLNPNMGDDRIVFDDPFGKYLTASRQIVESEDIDHTASLQGALGMTADQIDAMLESRSLKRAASLTTDETAAGYSIAMLDIATVSLLYRHGFLAKMLKLDVDELITFIQLSGINPFPSLQSTALSTISEDVIHERTMEFVDMASAFRARKIKAEAVDFWCRHEYDAVGSYAIDAALDLVFVHQVVSGVRNSIDAAGGTPDTEALLDQVTATTSAYLGSDVDMTETLLNTAAVMNDPEEVVAAGELPVRSLLDHFISLAGKGLRQEGFAAQDLSGSPTATDLDLSAPVGLKGSDGFGSVRWTGVMEARAAGEHVFGLQVEKAGVICTLAITPVDDAAAMQLLTGTSAAAERIELAATLETGRIYIIQLDVTNLNGSSATPLVRSNALPLGNITQISLYPPEVIARMEACALLTMRVRKALQVLAALGLSEGETTWLCSVSNATARLDLNLLPAVVDEADAARATELFIAMKGLVDYAALKADMNVSDDTLIDLISSAQGIVSIAAEVDPARTALELACHEAFANITRRTSEDISALAAYFGHAVTAGVSPGAGEPYAFNYPLYQDLDLLGAFWDALKIIGALGLPLEVIQRLLSDPANIDSADALALRQAVKACFEPDAWRRIAGPIFDRLRKKQRDALVAYLLHELDLDRVEQLYEYFLIDPAMEPVVLTSRIRQAIAAVQTFIHRCLLSMEMGKAKDNVHPSAIVKVDEWAWKKRYRVWEANRKIFLFPENFLEPEWRDDKSHLFKELESAIFQTDLTTDSAETVYYNYLRKLEEIAKLDVVTTYVEEVAGAPEENTVHVIGRTANLPHKYYYRTYQASVWSPWEPLDAEIEGDHIVTAMWKDRLYVFWLTFFEKSQSAAGDASIEDMKDAPVSDATEKFVEVQLNWCERFQAQWTPRASSGFGDPIRFGVPNSYVQSEVLVHVTREVTEESDELKIHVHFPVTWAIIYGKKTSYYGGYYDDTFASTGTNGTAIGRIEQADAMAFELVSKLVPPEVVPGALKPDDPFETPDRKATKEFGSGSLVVTFIAEVTTNSDGSTSEVEESQAVLEKGENKYSLVFPSAPLDDVDDAIAPLLAPFFYSDRNHLFFVEPGLIETTTAGWSGWMVIDEWSDWEPVIRKVVEETPVASNKGWVDPVPPLIDEEYVTEPIEPVTDWLEDPRVLVEFGDQMIGRTGSIPTADLVSVPTNATVGAAANDLVTTINSGSGNIVATPGTSALTTVVVGNAGLAAHVSADRTSPMSNVFTRSGRSVNIKG